MPRAHATPATPGSARNRIRSRPPRSVQHSAVRCARSPVTYRWTHSRSACAPSSTGSTVSSRAATGGAPHRVRAGDRSRRLQALYIQPAVNCAVANFVVYVVANFEWAGARFGDRAYRIGHLLGGVVAQRVSVAGAAAGLPVR